MKVTILSAAVALALSAPVAWADTLNDGGIAGAGQSAEIKTGAAGALINQSQTVNDVSSNGQIVGVGPATNGAQASDGSTANQIVGNLNNVNVGKLGSFNTRIVAIQRLESEVSGNNSISDVGNTARSSANGGEGARGGRGGNARGGSARGDNIAVGVAVGGRNTNTAGNAVGPTALSNNGAVTYVPVNGAVNGNTAGGGNGVAATLGLGLAGDGGNGATAGTAPGAIGGNGIGTAKDANSGGQTQSADQGSRTDQSADNNSGQIAGNAKGNAGDARTSTNAGDGERIGGHAWGGHGAEGGNGGHGGEAKVNAGAFEMANSISSAFSNGAGIMQSSMNSSITASVMQGVNIQANVGVGR